MSTLEDQELTPSERAARDAVRALPKPQPDEAFQAKLRHEFVSGRIGRRRERAAVRPWFAGVRVLVPLAASLVAVALLAANRGPDWRVVSAHGEGRIVVDGTPFAIADTPAIGARLRRGGRVQVQGAATLDLVAPGVAAVALAPGADMTLSSAPARWWRRGMQASLAAGDAYFTTGREFHGAQLDVRTAEAHVHAVGTAFAVLCAPFGTCVCVMEGQVRVGAADAPPADGVEVPHGMRRVVNRAGGAETLPILEDSVHQLHRQLSAVGGVLQR